MRKFELDNKAVICRNATTLGFAKHKIKRGDVFTYTSGDHSFVGRSLGRIRYCDNDGEDCRGYVCALVLGFVPSHAYVRWIDPDSITEVIDVPTKFAAFFFAKDLPFSNDMLLRLADYGTLSEQFIDNAPRHVIAWSNGVSPAAYDAGVRR